MFQHRRSAKSKNWGQDACFVFPVFTGQNSGKMFETAIELIDRYHETEPGKL